MARLSCTRRTRYQSGSDAAARTGTWRPMRIQRIPTRARGRGTPSRLQTPGGCLAALLGMGPPMPHAVMPHVSRLLLLHRLLQQPLHERRPLVHTHHPKWWRLALGCPLGCIAPRAGPDD